MPDGSNLDTPNLALWESLRPVDRSFTKPITGKSYKGDSPNPTYIIRKLTEALGPIGRDWGFDVVSEEVRLGQPHQIVVEQEQVMEPTGRMRQNPDGTEAPETILRSKRVRYEIIREEHHQVHISFWQIDPDGRKRTFSAFGGTPMLYMTRKGTWMHDEDAAKKSLTDAYTKGASWLGACADIFLGLFDDKYTSQPENIPASTGSPEPDFDKPKADKEPSPNRTNSAPEGW